MNIAILHSGDLDSVSLGGVDRYIKSLILFCDNYEISVYGVTKQGQHRIGEKYEKEYCGHKYYFIPIMDDKKYPLSIRYMYHIVSYIPKLKDYDCIFAQRTEYSVPFVCSVKKKKLIEIIHGSSKYSEVFFGKTKAKIHLLLENIAIKTARKTLVILNREEFGVPYYKSRYKKYADRFIYGRNPIDTRIYHPASKNECRAKLGIPVERKIVLYSGRVENIPKRVDLLPLICEEVVKTIPEAIFVIIGDGSDRNQLIGKINDMSLEDHFILPGYIDDPQKIALYNNSADVCLNMSIFEGTCTSLLEAVACGIPIIAADVGDVREVLKNGKNGILISDKKDKMELVKSFSEAIRVAFEGNISMDDSVLKYDGSSVIKELKELIRSL